MTNRPVIGHEKLVADLKTLARRGALAHGLLFHGPSMTGKRSTAQALARFLERGMGAGAFAVPAPGEVLQDAMTVDLAFAKQIDPARKDSVSIDAVREIRNFLWRKPVASPKRTLVIDEAEFLTVEAQNALLKVIEEPPASSLIIVVSSDLDSLLPTIPSRLQKTYFGAVPEPEIAAWLAAGGNLAAGGGSEDARPAPAAKPLTKAEAKALAKRAMGKPGLAFRLLNDAPFEKNLELAEKFLRAAPAARRDLIKELIEPENFNLRLFLEAVMLSLAWEKPSPARTARWHKALAIYGSAADFGLNPRLQLADLLL